MTNPLMTFDQYRESELRWYWYSVPDGATQADREAFSAAIEEKIRAAWRERQELRHPLKRRMRELTWQHVNVVEGDF